MDVKDEIAMLFQVINDHIKNSPDRNGGDKKLKEVGSASLRIGFHVFHDLHRIADALEKIAETCGEKKLIQ